MRNDGIAIGAQVTRRYEKEMFMCIADDMAKVFLDVFYNTRRNDLVLKMLHALFEYVGSFSVALALTLARPMAQLTCVLHFSAWC